MSAPTTTVFRMRPYVRNIAWAGLAFTSVMGTLSIWAALTNVDGSFPEPGRAAWIMGTIWSAFLLLSAWLLLAYHRYRLELGPDHVRQRGVIQDRTLRHDGVRRVVWRRVPSGGSVRLHGLSTTITIEFGTLPDGARGIITEHLRAHIAEGRQQGAPEDRMTAAEIADRQHRARSARRGMAIGFLLVALVFVGAAVAGHGWPYLLFATLNGWSAIHLLRPAPPDLKEHNP